MNVIPEETTAPAAMAPPTMMESPMPISSSPRSRVFRFKEVEEEEDSAPRRVSFRTNEIEQQKIALLVQNSLDEEDEDDETDEVLTEQQQPLPTPVQEEEEETCDRGFELKYSRERQTRKFTIIKSIVRNQKQCRPDQLAKLACICNKWASVAAQIQGEMDHQQAYRQSLSTSLTLPDMARFPMPFKKKRPAAGDDEDNQRRVRSRTN